MPIASDSATLNAIKSVGWDGLEAIGTSLAFFAAIWAINENNKQSREALERTEKQLEIEQEPLVVLSEISAGVGAYALTIKNIGRGPALSITGNVSKDTDVRNSAFFQTAHPHSWNLSSGGQFEGWQVDTHRIDEETIEESGYRYFYLFFKSQLGDLYRTEIKIKEVGVVVSETSEIGKCYKIMENSVEKIAK